jgi:acetyl coenzyme A synthetase (ADP forming)-like protein
MTALIAVPGVADQQQVPPADAEEQDVVSSLRPFFRPRAIAVIGASNRPGTIGARLVQAVLRGGYRGKVYPVNPHVEEVAGLRAFRSVRDIPEKLDLAIVATPREAVLGVVDDCMARGIPALLVITSGFAEVGPDAAALQQQLREKVRAGGMRLIGPNCLGVITTDPAVSLNATFVPVSPQRGPIGICSDSGALGLALVTALTEMGLGISSCVTVGNRADVSSTDVLEYLEADDATSLIVLYLESFGDARRFAQVARRVSLRKPIVMVKAGRTKAGIRAAGSHTAALAARDVNVDAVVHQTGVIRVDTLEELLDLTAALSMQPLPRGRRVAVLTNAGGPAILCADVCEASGLLLPELSTATQEKLAAFLPASAGLSNPVDMIASATPEQYHRAISTLLHSGEVDSLIVLYTAAEPSLAPAFQKAIAAAAEQEQARARHVPILGCLMAATDSARGTPQSPRAAQIPYYHFPEEPARVLGRMANYAEWRDQPVEPFAVFEDMDIRRARQIVSRALREETDAWLPTEDARELLRAAGLKPAPGGVARTAQQAVALARQVGFPVAVKLASHRILHKTEHGCVHLNLTDEEGVRAAFEAICDRLAHDWKLDDMEGGLVQPMIPGGVELLVGVTTDPQFGPLVAFGLGGIHVEVLRDVCFRVVPLTARDAREMIRSIRGLPLLLGHRGHPPADVLAVEELLLRVAYLVEKVPEVVELDLNPVFALPQGEGCVIADARVRVVRRA